MKKNSPKTIFVSFMLLLLFIGCRQDVLMEKQENFDASSSKFQIVQLKDIPQVTKFVKHKTGRNDLMIPMKNTSKFAKGEIDFANLESSFIVMKTEENLIYYVFNIINAGDDKTIYNFEVKEIEGEIVDAKVLEYASDVPYVGNLFEIFENFSGTVAAYKLDGIKISEIGFLDGQSPCEPPNPPGGGSGGGGGDPTYGIPPPGSYPSNPGFPSWPSFPSNPGGGNGSGGSSGGGSSSGGGQPGSSDNAEGCKEPWIKSLDDRIEEGTGLIYSVWINCKGETKKVYLSISASKLKPGCDDDGSGVILLPWINPKFDNPCAKTKAILENPLIQPAIAELKTQTTMGGEKGVKFKADGTPSAIIIGGAHSVNLGDKTGYQGGYHNHTPTGIPMFSVGDIDQLLGFALAQGNYGNPSNAFFGMVAPNGMHYVIRFNGSYNDALVSFSQAELNKLVKDYRELQNILTDSEISGSTYINADGSINNLGVEKLFFETLNNMGLTNKIVLQRIESDPNNGTEIIKNIALNSSNIPTPSICP